MTRFMAACRSASEKSATGCTSVISEIISLGIFAPGVKGLPHQFNHTGNCAEDEAHNVDPVLMQPAVEKSSPSPSDEQRCGQDEGDLKQPFSLDQRVQAAAGGRFTARGSAITRRVRARIRIGGGWCHSSHVIHQSQIVERSHTPSKSGGRKKAILAKAISTKEAKCLSQISSGIFSLSGRKN